MTDVKMNLRTILYDNKKVSQISDEEQNKKQEQEELEVEEQETVEPGSVGVNNREGSLFALEQEAMLASIGQKVSAGVKSEATMTEYEISGMKFSVSQADSASGFTYKIEDNRIIFTGNKCTINIDEVTNDKFEIEIYGSEVTLNSNAKVASITNNANKSVINGSDENDVIIDKSSRSIINGGAGDDVISSFGLTTTIHGGDGNDTITSTGAFSKVYGDSGKDNITATGASVTVDLGDEKDTAYVEGKNIDVSTNDGNSIVDGKGKNITVNSDTDSTNKIILDGQDNSVQNKSTTDHIEVNGKIEQEGHVDSTTFDKYGIDDGKMYVNGKLLTGIGKDNKMYKDGEPLTGISVIDNRLYKGGIIDTEEQIFEGKLYSGGSLARGIKEIGDTLYINGIPQKKYDEEGYDKDGYDREGYNRQGYNREGYDREGYKLNEDGSKTKHVYDNGKIVGDKIVAKDGSSILLSYNDKGETISKKSYNTRGQLIVYEEYQNGKTVSTTTYRKDGTISSYTKINDDNTSYTLLYDNDGKKILSRTDFNNDVIRKTTSYTNGNISKIVVYDDKGQFQIQTEYASDGSAKSYDVEHKLLTGTVNEITYVNGEVDVDALYNTLVDKGYVDSDGKMLTHDMWKFLESNNLVDSEKNPIDKNTVENLLERIELKPDNPDGFDEDGNLWIGGKLHTGPYTGDDKIEKLYLEGKLDTRNQIYEGNGKLYLNGLLAIGTHDFEGKLYTDGDFDTRKQLYKNQLWDKGELSKGQDTFEGKLYANGDLDTKKQLYKNQLWNNGELSKGTDDFEGKLYTDGNFDTTKQLYKNQLWNNGELSKGTDDFEGKLYTNGDLDTKKQLYKNQLWNNGERSKGTDDFEGKLYTNGDLDTKKQLYKNQLWNNAELSKGTDDFEGKLYTNGDFDTKKQLYKNQLWNNGELSKGTDDFEGKLYTNGDFDTKKQLYKNQLWNNGELSKGTDDFEGKLYTNGDLDTKKQLYKNQLWNNGELSKGTDDFEGKLYTNGDFDTKKQLYKNQLWDNGELSKGTDDFEGKLYTNGDLDRTKQLYKNQLWDNGELSKGKDEFGGLVYFDGDIANGDIGDEKYIEGILVREKIKNSDNTYTVNNYNIEKQKLSERNYDESDNLTSMKFFEYEGATCIKTTEYNDIVVSEGKLSSYTEVEKITGGTTTTKEINILEHFNDYGVDRVVYTMTVSGTTLYYVAQEPRISAITDDEATSIFATKVKANGAVNGKLYEDGELISPVKHEDGFWYSRGEKCDGEYPLADGSKSTFEGGILIKNVLENDEGTIITRYADNDDKKYTSVIGFDKSNRVTLIQTYKEGVLACTQNEFKYDDKDVLTGYTEITEGETPLTKTYEILSRSMGTNGSYGPILLAITENEKTYLYRAMSVSELPTKETTTPEIIKFNSAHEFEGIYNNSYYLSGGKTPDEYSEYMIFLDSIGYTNMYALTPNGRTKETAELIALSDEVKSDIDMYRIADTLAKAEKEKALSEGKSEGEALEIYRTIFDNSVNSQMVKDYKASTLSDEEILTETKVGDVIEKSDGIYVNDGTSLYKLKMSKGKYLELFPPIERFAARQGGLGDCYFIASIFSNCMKNSQTYAQILKMFAVDESNNITVTFRGDLSDYPVPFNNGNLYSTPIADGAPAINYIEEAFALASFADTYNTEISAIDINEAFELIDGGWEETAINSVIQPEFAVAESLNLKFLPDKTIDDITQEQMDTFVPVMTDFFSEKLNLINFEEELYAEFNLRENVVFALSDITNYCGEIWAESYKEGVASAETFRTYLKNNYYDSEIIDKALDNETLCRLITKVNNSAINYKDLRKSCSRKESEFVGMIWDVFEGHSEICWALFDIEDSKESLERFVNNTNEFGFKEALKKENETNLATLTAKLDAFAEDVNSKKLILGASTLVEDNAKYSVFGGHAYAIESIDTENKTLRIVNPWACAVNVEIPYSGFAQYFGSLCISYSDDVATVDNGTDKFDRYWKDGKVFTGEIDGKVYEKGILLRETVSNEDHTTTIKNYTNSLKEHNIILERTVSEDGKILSQTNYQYNEKNELIKKTEQKDLTYDTTTGKLKSLTEVVTEGTVVSTSLINITDYYQKDAGKVDEHTVWVPYFVYTVTKDGETKYYTSPEPAFETDPTKTSDVFFPNKILADGEIHGGVYDKGTFVGYRPIKNEDGLWYLNGEKCDGDIVMLDGTKNTYDAGVLIKNTAESDKGTTITRYADNDEKNITSIVVFDKEDKLVSVSEYDKYNILSTQSDFTYNESNKLSGFTITSEGVTETYSIINYNYLPEGEEETYYPILFSKTVNGLTTLHLGHELSPIPTKDTEKPSIVRILNSWEFEGVYNESYYLRGAKTPDEYGRYMIFLKSIGYDTYIIEPNGFTSETVPLIDLSDKVESDIDMLIVADTLAKADKEEAISEGKSEEEAQAIYQTTFNNSVNSQMVKDYKTTALSDEEILTETQVGDVIEKTDGIYVNDGANLYKLKMSKEKYLELFPPVKRFSARQGGLGDCYFISSVFSNCMKNSQTYSQILKMFDVDSSNNITITFKGDLSDYPVPFAEGNLYSTPIVQGAPAVNYIEEAFALASFADIYDTEISAIDINEAFDLIEGGWESAAINNVVQPQFSNEESLDLRFLASEMINSITQTQIDTFVPVLSDFFSTKIDLLTLEEQLFGEFNLNEEVVASLRDLTDFCGEIWSESYKEGIANADTFRNYMNEHNFYASETINNAFSDDNLCRLITNVNNSEENYKDLVKNYFAKSSTFYDTIWSVFPDQYDISSAVMDAATTKESLSRFLNNTNNLGFKDALKQENEVLLVKLTAKLETYADDVNSKKLLLGSDTRAANGKYSVYDSHAYTIESIDTENKTLRIVNPWACAVNIEIPFSEFGIYFYDLHFAYVEDVVTIDDGTDKFGRLWKDGKTYTGEIEGKVYNKGLLIKETIANLDGTTTVKLYNNDLKNHHITSERILNEENIIVSQKMYEYKDNVLEKIIEQKDITYDTSNNKISGFTEIITIGTDVQTNVIRITDRYERSASIYVNGYDETLPPPSTIKIPYVVYTITTNGETKYYTSEEPELGTDLDYDPYKLFPVRELADGEINGGVYDHGRFLGYQPTKNEDDGLWYLSGEKCDGEILMLDGTKNTYDDGVLIKNVLENDEGTTVTRYADNDITKISSVLKFDTNDRATLIQIYNGEGSLTANQNLRYDEDGNLVGFDNIISEEPPEVETYEILSRTMGTSGSYGPILLSVTKNEKTILYRAMSISDIPTKSTEIIMHVSFNSPCTFEGIYDNKYYMAGRAIHDSEYIIFLESIDHTLVNKVLPAGYYIDMVENIQLTDTVKSDIDILMTADTLAKAEKEKAISDGKSEAEAQEIYQTTFDNSVASQMVKDYKASTLSDEAVLLETTVGDVIEKSDGIYVNDGNALSKLAFTKEKYLEMFPIVERFSTKQGGIGDCFFISSILSSCFTNPQTYAHILKMFSIDESNNITITFKGDFVDYPVTFLNGELFTNDGKIDGEPAEHPVGNQLEGCLSAKYIEQAYALARFASAYNEEISAIDLDAAYDLAYGGDCNVAINEVIQSNIASIEMMPIFSKPETVSLINDESMGNIASILTRYLNAKDKIETIEHSLFDGVIEGEVIEDIQNMHFYCPEIWTESLVEGSPSAIAFREHLTAHHKGAERINALLTDEQICTLITKITSLPESYASSREEYNAARSKYNSDIGVCFTAETISVKNVAIEKLLNNPKDSLEKIENQGLRKTLEDSCNESTAEIFGKFDALATSVNNGNAIFCAGTSGENHQYYILNNHAYAIIGIDVDAQTIKIVNPWSCSVAIDVPYVEFVEKFGRLYTADLNDLVTIDNGTDQFDRLWKDRKLYTGDLDNTLYKDGVIDRTTQVYEGNGKLYVNGTVASGTQDFEGKLYTNGDLDKTPQIYKGQLWSNGELSKGLEPFGNLTYYNGDIANGDIGNETYSSGLLIRRKNEDNTTTVNSYDSKNNLSTTRVHDENGNMLSICLYSYNSENILQDTLTQTNIVYDSLTGRISSFDESIISTSNPEDNVTYTVIAEDYYRDKDNNKKIIFCKINGGNSTYYEKNDTPLPCISTQDAHPIYMDYSAEGVINGVTYSSGSIVPVSLTDTQIGILNTITELDTNMFLSFSDIKGATFTSGDNRVTFNANGYIWHYEKTSSMQTLYAEDCNGIQVYYGTFKTSDNSKIKDLKINDDYYRGLNFLYSLGDDVLAQYADIDTLKPSIYTDSVYVDFNFSPKVQEDINILKAADIAVKTDTTGTVTFGGKVAELTVKNYSIADAETKTKAGEVFTIGDALYVNDGEKMMPLKMTKAQYLELFPTLGRYAVSQGGYGDCYFVSGVLLGSAANPISYAQLLQMMDVNQVTGDVTVTFNGLSDYPVKFEKGELFVTDYRGSGGRWYSSKIAINTSKGMRMFEQAFALAKFAYDSSATIEAKDLDIDDAMAHIENGLNNEAQNAVFGEELGAECVVLNNCESYSKSSIDGKASYVKNYLTAKNNIYLTEEAAGLSEYKDSDIMDAVRYISYCYTAIDESKNLWVECIVEGRANTEKLTELFQPIFDSSKTASSVKNSIRNYIALFAANDDDFQKIALGLKNKPEYMAQASAYILKNNDFVSSGLPATICNAVAYLLYDESAFLNDINEYGLYTALVNDQNKRLDDIVIEFNNGNIIYGAGTNTGASIDEYGKDKFITDGHAYMIWSMDKDRDKIVIGNPWQGALTTTITFKDFTKYFYQIFVAETSKIPRKELEVIPVPLTAIPLDNVVSFNNPMLLDLVASSPQIPNNDIAEFVYYENDNRRILYSIGEGDGARYYTSTINEEPLGDMAVFVSSKMSDDKKELANGYIDGKEYVDGVLQPEE